MASQIPGAPPSPQTPHPKDALQQPTPIPQANRLSIPPRSSQEGVNVGQMAALVKDDQKRKRAAPEEEKKELESDQPVDKKRELEPGSQGKIEKLLQQVVECFGPLPKDIGDLQSIASFCFEKIQERIHSPGHLKSGEIAKIYGLLFATDLVSFCDSIVSQPLNPIDPHPAHIFHSLNSCLSRLDGTCKETRVKYLTEHPSVKNYFEKVPLGRRTPALLEALEKGQAGFIDALKGAPVYTTRELLGTNNVNPVYILHDGRHNPAWVFKPVLRKLNLDEKKAYQMPADGSGYKKYSSGDPQEPSSRFEHAAYCLNFHKQFPIPFTFMVEINGDVGSVQLFIRGQEVEVDSSVLKEESFSTNLQAMLIFDLLFANRDRHQDNFLVRNLAQNTYQLYAIDHDACCHVAPGPELKLLYLDFLSGYSFKKDLHSLFSPDAIEKYEGIMRKLDLPNISEWSKWADFVAEKLQNPDGLSLKRLTEEIMTVYKQRFSIT